MTLQLKGKNVLISGSSRGIGWGIAKAFAAQGANIALNSRKDIAPEQLAEIEAYGVRCISVAGDVIQQDAAGEMIKTVIQQLGSLDILINNAGITKDTLLLRMSQEDFEEVLRVNLTGTFNLTQKALRGMVKRRSGKIINLASVNGQLGAVGQANYAASKAGIIGFTKSVAREYAERGVHCNAIAPGFIETDMTAVLDDKLKETMRSQIPVKKFGTVDDVAQAAIFLATSSYITGQVINVDGGLVMQG